MEIEPSSDPWRKTMRQCLESLESFGNEITLTGTGSE